MLAQLRRMECRPLAHSRRSAAAGVRSVYRRIADVRAGMSAYRRIPDATPSGAEGRSLTRQRHSRPDLQMGVLSPVMPPNRLKAAPPAPVRRTAWPPRSALIHPDQLALLSSLPILIGPGDRHSPLRVKKRSHFGGVTDDPNLSRFGHRNYFDLT